MATLPSSREVVGFAAAVVASVLLFPLAFSGRMFSLEVTEALDSAMGEGHWQSAVYAGWDAIFVVGMVLGAVVFFRKFLGTRTRLGVFASRQNYAVYLIHTPMVVYLAYVLRNVEMASLPKFGLVSVIGVPVCFGAAWVIRRVPGVQSVL